MSATPPNSRLEFKPFFRQGREMEPVATFWCEPSGRVRRYLRCYSRGQMDPAAPEASVAKLACGGYCQALKLLDEVDEEWGEPLEDGRRLRVSYDPRRWPWDAFPTVCDRCQTEMTDPERQIFVDEVLVAKTGEHAGQTWARRELPVGAMFEAVYHRDIPEWCGFDGIAVVVVVPGGEWFCDSRANNCTKPEDTKHRCWIRHGDVKTGYLHVDKEATPERPTCEAGAGSIWMSAPKGWHGFAYRGFLIDADGDWRAVVDRKLDGVSPLAPAEQVKTPVVARDLRRVRQFQAARARPVPEMAGRRRWASNR